MKKRRTLLPALAMSLFALVPLTSLGGKIQLNAIPNNDFFGIKIAGTDQIFYGRADRINSITFEEYTTGTFIVSEVSIDMLGSNQLLRIYSTRIPGTADVQNRGEKITQAAGSLSNTGSLTTPTIPIPSAVTRAEEALQDTTSQSLSGLVVKAWPATTHAKTIEFSVGTKAELQTFHRQFSNLLIGKPIKVKKDNVVSAQSATADDKGMVSINKIGGTLFIIE